GLTNESFNDVMGARHAESLWKRITESSKGRGGSDPKAPDRQDAKYELYMMAFMFREGTGICQDSKVRHELADRVKKEWDKLGMNEKYPYASEADRSLILLGLHGLEDFALGERMIDNVAGSTIDQQHIWQRWNYIAIYLGNLISVMFVNHLV